ncbi:MAG: LytTR family DNA-binding domain-containing protein [Gammaproteobacteria bacterium]|nr:LytTR family DNA-binding domain-containing protein [Gammaproteobacteria bacterium]
MNSLGILIVDDEPLARARLARQLHSIEGCRLLGEAFDTQTALVQLQLLDPDLLLLDIDMPGQSGLELAQQLSHLDHPPAVIFCTALDQFAVPAFATSAVGYLLKPITRQQLTDALNQARQLNKLQLNQSFNHPINVSAPLPGRSQIKVINHRRIQLLEVSAIRCLVADNKYVIAHHPAGEAMLSESLVELEAEFGQRFVRVHRNALVAVEFIVALQKNGSHRIQLNGVTIQPLVSRRLAPTIKNLIEQLCFT